MVVFPNAKLNIGLNVIERRSDGFHNLESLFYPVPLYDALEAIPAQDWRMQYYGDPIQTSDARDTVQQAIDLLQQHISTQPAHLCVYKKIPQAAGLGGGSADGTFTLTLLNEVLDLGLSNSELTNLSQLIGSDCPFFIRNQPSLVTGKGEQITPTDSDLSGYYFGIVAPPFSISTGAAYQHITPKKPDTSINKAIQYPIQDWPSLLSNDFEAYAFKAYPALKTLKTSLYNKGALYASMTGSGSAFYGIFEKEPQLSELDWPSDYRVFEGRFK